MILFSRKLLSLSSFILICSFCILSAQAPDTLWTKTYGGINTEQGFSVKQTADGGYIITGRAGISPNYQVYLLKTDAMGDSLWAKIYGETDQSGGYSVQETSDGSYIIAGYTASFYGGTSNVYILKTDMNGDTLWTRHYGGVSWAIGHSVQETIDSGYVIVGSRMVGMDCDVYLIKTDRSGDTLWTKNYSNSLYAEGRAVQQTFEGGYIITGYQEHDVWLINTDENGTIKWTGSYGGPDSDRGKSVQPIYEGGYMIAGQSGWPYDVYLVRTDSIGDTLWTKMYGGVGHDGGESLQKTQDGCYVIAGWTESFGAGGRDVYLIKIDENGDTLWTTTYGGASFDAGYDVQITNDGGYIIVGYSNSFGVNDDVYLIKTVPDVGISGGVVSSVGCDQIGSTIISYPLHLPKNKKCRVFDIAGRLVEPVGIIPGIYFIEVEGAVIQKVVKVR